MVDRNRTLLVLVAVVTVTLAGCGAKGEPATVDAPAWHAGYTWSHDGTTHYVFEEVFGDERDNGTGSADFVRTERVVNTGLDADGEPAYLTVQRYEVDGDDGVGLPSGPVLGAYRQSDLKPLQVEGLRRESCSGQGACSVGLQGVALHDERPDEMWLPFPLRTGDSWSGTYEAYGDEVEMRYTVEVGRMRTVQTPVGPVDALRLDVRHRPTNLAEVVQEFQEEAREEGYPIEDLRIDIRRDEVYYYSPAYQAVVQGVSTGQDLFSATLPDGQGGRMEARSESRFEQRVELSGARLVAGPELTLAEVADLLRPDADFGNVTGVPVPEATYRVGVSVVDGEVNAFAGEAGRFEAVLDGVEALPEGHVLRWSLESGGVTRASAEGGADAAFEPRPERPGRYAVVLEAVDADGAVVASAGSGFVAHYEGTLDVACGPVNLDAPLVQVGGCATVPIPVHAGVSSLLVRAVPDGIGPGNPSAQLVVVDSIGRPVPVRSEGGAHVVSLEDFEGLNVDDAPWQADWEVFAGVLDGASLEVRVDYGAAPKSTVAEPQPDGRGGARLPAWLARA